MKSKRRNETQTLHMKLNKLDRELAEPDCKWERARIRRQLVKLRQEAEKPPESEMSENPSIPLKLEEKSIDSPQGKQENDLPQPDIQNCVSEKVALAIPIEQRPYWGKCRQMSFAELRSYIDNSLKKLFVSDSNDYPRTKEEFLDLWKMLREKIGSPVRPQFMPPEQLKSMLDQQNVLKERLATACHNPSATKRSLKKLQRKSRLLQWDINLLTSRERRNYKERRDAYLRRGPRRFQFTERIRKDIERSFEFGVPTMRLPWRVLPAGELSRDTVLRHYEALQRRNPHIKYEKERIVKALSLRPNAHYVGSGEFEGYSVFTFSHTSKALLECPVFGNAVYIINSDWKRLSKLTKKELIAHREATKIVHKKDWFQKVKEELNIS